MATRGNLVKQPLITGSPRYAGLFHMALQATLSARGPAAEPGLPRERCELDP
jgi:hypothetical protein